ncbi:MAG: chemotaxis protein CheD [Magnetococcales bacterium]|nr:chemotaxis protein CheD [Magnetococcales bacterium]NGZ26480.1 chemotaxis protein CheD [Magnetococcales bacterium]
MFHSKSNTGAMCHGLLPTCHCGLSLQTGQTCDDCFRYMDCSIHYMVNEFSAMKIPSRELTVKLFGGADMFSTGQSKTVGNQNIAVAKKILREKSMPIFAEDVAGEQGRKIFFFTHTGEVRLKRLGKNRQRYAEFQEELAVIRTLS